MYCKSYCLLFLLLLFSSSIFADIIRLADFDEDIDAKLIEVNEAFVKVVIPKEEIGSISTGSEKDGTYTDAVFISRNGKKHKVACKIVKVTKEPGSITLKIPRLEVSAIQIAFPESGDDVGKQKGESDRPSVDPEKLKEEIMKELMAKIEKKQRNEKASFEDDLREELRLEIEERMLEGEEVLSDEDYGDVRGLMLFKGKPLLGCGVKIVLLEKWGWNIMGGVKVAGKFETVTNESGLYRFKKVPPGGYKLYWKPPKEASWIRKLKMEPDIFVEAGETHYLPDRETNIRTIN